MKIILDLFLFVCLISFLGCVDRMNFDNQANNNYLSEKDLKNKYRDYLFFKFDVDGNQLLDYIIVGNSDIENNVLYIYLHKNQDKYELSSYGTNFNEDGGNRFSEIIPRNNSKGFIISTSFPDRGYYIKDYYISPSSDMKNQWVLDKIVEKGYISGNIAGKYYEDYFYYCNHMQKNNFFTYDMRISFDNYNDEEKLEKCSISMEYTVSEQQAEIFNNDFRRLNPKNYFIVGDKITAIDQNDDWVKVSYKNDSKSGWVDKRRLTPDDNLLHP
ncbi:Uncharacterised protein [Moraxella lacunata]|uniref:SH3b domain-containing protein n=1 Tax=Moraxella lacunata TaxID=477 RepID=A0A378QJS5_MORLA|nr:hypothetical protein [Moraxella lacunata]STZ00730.1 Uncharacterised protein [Moraxella lacunata]